MSARLDTSALRSVGVFAVSVDAGRMRDFAAAVGANADGSVPFAFPVSWLSNPEIRAALVAAVQGDAGSSGGVLPVHLEQSIALSEPLRLGEDYLLSLAIEGPDPRRIVQITGQITARDTRAVGSLGLRLALVALDGDQTSSRPGP